MNMSLGRIVDTSIWIRRLGTQVASIRDPTRLFTTHGCMPGVITNDRPTTPPYRMRMRIVVICNQW